MHFTILKVIATSGFLTALDCTKFDFGRGSAPDSAGGYLQRSPRPSSWFKGPTSKERRGKGTGKEGRGRREGGEEIREDRERGNGREGVGMPGKWGGKEMGREEERKEGREEK